MKGKWYLGFMIVALTVLGVVNQQYVSVPNQEIILQFADRQSTSKDAKITVNNVMEQLQNAGIENIHIKAIANGTVKITYYSAVDVLSVKKLLSESDATKLGYTHSNNKGDNEPSFPLGDDTNGCQLSIYEIHKTNDFESDLEGNCVLEQKLESDRFFNPKVYIYSSASGVKERSRVLKLAFKVQRNAQFVQDNTSYQIPEVRAGPIS